MCLLVTSCSYILWRERTEIASTDWVKADAVVELFLEYEERDAWVVAAGTTDKRNFWTEARMILVRGKSTEHSGTVGNIRGSPVGHAYWFGGAVVFLVSEAEGPRAKTWLVRLTPQGIEKIGGLTGENTLRFLPSPDRTRAVVQIDQGRAGSFLVFVRDDFSQDIRCGVSSRLAFEPGDDFTWDRNGQHLFLRRQGKVWTWDGCSALQRAQKFPACFSPATEYEGSVSEEGMEYFRSGPGENPVLTRHPSWHKFQARPETTDPERIGIGCP